MMILLHLGFVIISSTEIDAHDLSAATSAVCEVNTIIALLFLRSILFRGSKRYDIRLPHPPLIN